MTYTMATPALSNFAVTFDVGATVLATVLASVISSIVAWRVARWTSRAQTTQALLAHVDRIVDLAIAYPYLEDDEFCKNWAPSSADTRLMRYDNYCCQVFNLLERIWRFCGGNTDKMNWFIYYQEMVVRHRNWWRSQDQNKIGYQVGFRAFVDALAKGGIQSHGHKSRSVD